MIDVSRYEGASYPAYKTLESNFGSFLRKFIADPELSDTDKYRCLDSLCTKRVKSKTEMAEKCTQFFNKNKLKGSSCPNVISQNPYVRIHTKDSFLSWIGQIIGLTIEQTKSKLTHLIYVSDTTLKHILFESFINCTAIPDSYSGEENCLRYFGVKRWLKKSLPKLKDACVIDFNYIQWSFPKPVNEDIFKDQNIIETLACRVGLLDKNKKIIYLHKLDGSYNVKKPTIYDAGFYNQFEPGGKTKPLKECQGLAGFSEFVHKPNIFSNLESTFYETFNS